MSGVGRLRNTPKASLTAVEGSWVLLGKCSGWYCAPNKRGVSSVG